jgi:hypothetical protein
MSSSGKPITPHPVLEVFLVVSYFKKSSQASHPRNARIRLRHVMTIDTSKHGDMHVMGGGQADYFRVILAKTETLDARAASARQKPCILHWLKKNDDLFLPSNHKIHSFSLRLRLGAPIANHPDPDVPYEFAPLVSPQLDFRLFTDDCCDPLIHLTDKSVCLPIAFSDEGRRLLKGLLGETTELQVEFGHQESRWKVGERDWVTTVNTEKFSEHMLCMIAKWIVPNVKISQAFKILPSYMHFGHHLPNLVSKQYKKLLELSNLCAPKVASLSVGQDYYTDGKIWKHINAYYTEAICFYRLLRDTYPGLLELMTSDSQSESPGKALHAYLIKLEECESDTYYSSYQWSWSQGVSRVPNEIITRLKALFKFNLDQLFNILTCTVLANDEQTSNCYSVRDDEFSLAFLLKRFFLARTSQVQIDPYYRKVLNIGNSLVEMMIKQTEVNNPSFWAYSDANLGIVATGLATRVYCKYGPGSWCVNKLHDPPAITSR